MTSSTWWRLLGLAVLALPLAVSRPSQADEKAALAGLSAEVLSKEERTEAAGALDREIRQRIQGANSRNRDTWNQIASLKEWEAFRDVRIAALRSALGDFPAPPATLAVRTTGKLQGDGFVVENTIYESRPGQWVTANLYVPAKPTASMPGILIAHAHHQPKAQSELQDMGMTWARAGCLVLVIDQLGYGERRPHPFHRDTDYAKPYRPSRQDYYFRYDNGVNLALLGDSLMGWMAWDLSRGVDLLLARPGIDPKRILLLGAVAGGGDPAGVTAALDPRIAGCVPFNFGGPQPETRYPLPDNAEETFNYLGGAYWESTRGLRLGGRDDFVHWVIVGSIAPRKLIHSHEFAWDGERDPVWKRYQKVWGSFYNSLDGIGVAHGTGLLSGRPPEASHCTNIGRLHRKMIHPLFEKWFGIKVGDADEYSKPYPSSELVCLTDAARSSVKPKSLNEVMVQVGEERVSAARKELTGKSKGDRVAAHRALWTKVLGSVSPQAAPKVLNQTRDDAVTGGAVVERVVLEVEPGFVVPVLVLSPSAGSGRKPVVVAIAQGGKAGFLQHRSSDVTALVQSGTVVVLPDVRGTGESRAGSSRGRDSSGTNHSSNLLLFGETLLGERLRDVRSVLQYVRARGDVDAQRVAIWGDSFAATNTANTDFKVPHAVDGRPLECEPAGAMLALLAGLFDDGVRAVCARGGLASYHGMLTHYAVHVPHDAAVPGTLKTGDVADLAASLAPRALRLESFVNHLNLPVSTADLKQTLTVTQAAYGTSASQLTLGESNTPLATWFAEKLK